MKAAAKNRPARRVHRRGKSTTHEILGRAAETDAQIPPKWRRYARLLTDLRNRFHAQKDQLKRDAEEPEPGIRQHPADVATDSYDRDWALGLLSADQDLIYEIEAALNRIQNGTYGICEATGKRIPTERLEAIPWTRFTAEAEREFERAGERPQRKPQLGPREAVPRERAPEPSDEAD